jgi:hypothetical protein
MTVVHKNNAIQYDSLDTYIHTNLDEYLHYVILTPGSKMVAWAMGMSTTSAVWACQSGGNNWAWAMMGVPLLLLLLLLVVPIIVEEPYDVPGGADGTVLAFS